MLRSVAFDSSTASATPCRLWRIRVMAAVSMAMSLPPPIAMPTSACASAGASLMPSPTIATRWPCACSCLIAAALPSGSTPAITRSIPASLAMALAVTGLSPVSITS
ncbi:Uncharacterised protein [Serratia marcescens]|nr:Uncharacterised protein [Serratia marcescens]